MSKTLKAWHTEKKRKKNSLRLESVSVCLYECVCDEFTSLLPDLGLKGGQLLLTSAFHSPAPQQVHTHSQNTSHTHMCTCVHAPMHTLCTRAYFNAQTGKVVNNTINDTKLMLVFSRRVVESCIFLICSSQKKRHISEKKSSNEKWKDEIESNMQSSWRRPASVFTFLRFPKLFHCGSAQIELCLAGIQLCAPWTFPSPSLTDLWPQHANTYKHTLIDTEGLLRYIVCSITFNQMVHCALEHGLMPVLFFIGYLFVCAFVCLVAFLFI